MSAEQLLPSLYEGEAYRNFVKHISNPMTMVNYVSRFKKFIDYCQITKIDDLLYNGNTKKIQTMISDFLIHIQGQGFSSATVAHHRTTVKFFYEMNDITGLNWKKIARVMKPFRKKANDRPYTTTEIAKMLEKVDQRGRIIILLMYSSGMREGAIHSIKIAHLQKMEDTYKITVYKNEPDEYITFCSPECAKAIDEYLEYRRRYGEIIKPSSPLIREMFDKNNIEQAASPKDVKVGAIKNVIYHAIYDAGLREKKNVIKGQERILHDVMQSHGLRKFFETQAVGASMDLFTAEFLMGHKGGLPLQSYIKPTIQQLFNKYVQIADAVTINEENKLRKEVQILTMDRNKLKSRLERLEQACKDFL